MELSSLMGGGGAGGAGGGGGAGGKSPSSASSSTSGNNFAGLVSGDGGALTPLAGVVLAALSLFAFLGLVLIAKK